MTTQEAIDIVSYKVGIKLGEIALEDDLFNHDRVRKALSDKESNTEEDIDLKSYMLATKQVKEERKKRFKEAQYA